jgi:hypothetical protein
MFSLVRKSLLSAVVACCAASAHAQTWTPVNVTNPGNEFLNLPLLMTDGTVIMQGFNGHWWRLTPDSFGSYVNGTWQRVAATSNLPGIGLYSPEFISSAVLPDGRPLLMGGISINTGATYSPLLGAWRGVPAPGFTVSFGSPSVVLANGTYMQSGNGNTSVALLDANTLTWTTTGSSANQNTEKAWVLLPNGNVLSLPSQGSKASEQYNPGTGTWSSAGDTPVVLWTSGAGQGSAAIMLPTGNVVAFGATFDASVPGAVTPTAIYNTTTDTWSGGPNLPQVNGKNMTLLADPVTLLPSGNLLVAAGVAGDTGSTFPTHFFEFDGTTFTQVPDPSAIFAGTQLSDLANMLVLPTGQILLTWDTPDVAIYTPASLTPCSGCAPAITSFPAKIVRGVPQSITGTQMNGFSEAQSDPQVYKAATNYPLVQIVNTATGHVFYARTSNSTTMSIAPGVSSTASFTVSGATETGASLLYVIANGIPSSPVSVTIQ